MRNREAVWQQLAQLAVRPPVDDERSDEVEVGTRVDAVRDAGGDDGQDRERTYDLAAPRPDQRRELCRGRRPRGRDRLLYGMIVDETQQPLRQVYPDGQGVGSTPSPHVIAPAGHIGGGGCVAPPAPPPLLVPAQ
jgi:hypothetical protein